VRAYAPGEASADRGMITTAELRYLLPRLNPVPGRVQLAGLFDHGYAEINTDPLSGTTDNLRHMYGAGFGVNWLWGSLVSLKTSVAWRLAKAPASGASGGDNPMVYFQGVIRF
jgi:hemolysin activation/secretion protein